MIFLTTYTHTCKIILHSEPMGMTSEYIWLYLHVIVIVFLSGEAERCYLLCWLIAVHIEMNPLSWLDMA